MNRCLGLLLQRHSCSSESHDCFRTVFISGAAGSASTPTAILPYQLASPGILRRSKELINKCHVSILFGKCLAGL